MTNSLKLMILDQANQIPTSSLYFSALYWVPEFFTVLV